MRQKRLLSMLVTALGALGWCAAQQTAIYGTPATVPYGIVTNRPECSVVGFQDELPLKIPTDASAAAQPGDIVTAPQASRPARAAQSDGQDAPALPPLRAASNNTTAPMPVTDLKADFPNGSLKGTVSFTMPTKTMNGGNLWRKYVYCLNLYDGNLSIDGSEYIGLAMPGDTVEIEVEFPNRYLLGGVGVYVYEYSQRDLYSERVSVTQAIGEWCPVFAEHPKLRKSKDSNTLNLTWDVVPMHAEGSDYEAYYNPDELAFRIIRQPDGVIVADNYKGRSFTETCEQSEPQGVHYSVWAIYKGELINTGYWYKTEIVSNNITIGDGLPLPYSAFDEAFDISVDWPLWSNFFIDTVKDGIYNIFGRSSWDCYQSKEAYKADLSNKSHMDGENDWLVSPPLRFNEQGVYKISMLYDHTSLTLQDLPVVEAYFGDDLSPEGLRQPLIFQRKQTDRVNDHGNFFEYSGYISVNNVEQKNYYIGFVANLLGNRIRNFKVEALPSANVPDSVTSLLASPIDVGQMATKVSFVTPTKDALGNQLTALTRVDVFRCDTILISSQVSPRLGESLSVVDDNPEYGYNPYKVVACDENGVGIPGTVEVFIGLDQPVDVAFVKKSIANGKLKLEWEPVTQGVHGQPIGDVKYTVVDGSKNIIADNLTDTKCEIPCELGGQPRFVTAYYVGVKNDMRKSANYVPSRDFPIILGAAEKLTRESPYQESFLLANQGKLTKWLGSWTPSSLLSPWELYTEKMTPDADGDGYFIHVQQYGASTGLLNELGVNSHQSAICTKNFDLSQFSNPSLRFFIQDRGYQTDHSHTNFQVYMIINYGERIALGNPITVASLGVSNEWKLMEIPLTDVVGDGIVRFEFMATSPAECSCDWCLDGIRISDRYKHDLEVQVWGENGVKEVKVDHTSNILFKVTNYGDETAFAKHYSINVYRNDEYQMSIPSIDLASAESRIFTFSAMGLRQDETVNYRVEVMYDVDENIDNNADDINLAIIQPKLPRPLELSGYDLSGKAMLEWSAPIADDVSKVDIPLTDGAESYGDYDFGGIEAGVHEGHLGDWTVFNGNTDDILSRAPLGNSPMAWASINSRKLPEYLKKLYEPNNGNHVFCSNVADYDEWGDFHDTNHWLVTPKLNGAEQVIDFYAKSVHSPQMFDVMYSTSETLENDVRFYRVAQGYVPNDGIWHHLEVTVPDGTNYVCFLHNMNIIYCTGYLEGDGLLLDDISFTVEGDASELEVRDYTVYRDNKVIATGVTETSYVDYVPKPGAYTYRVSANYAEAGESALSNEVELLIINPADPSDPNSALDDLTVDGQVTVRPVDGGIEVCNASDQQVSVYNVAGQLMARVAAHSDVETIALAPGVYLVTAGNRVGKVLVK